MPPDLLAAVLATPDDDLPRLIAADWLEENGEPARAEFIRVQIELASRQSDHETKVDPHTLSLLSRERILIHLHSDEWLSTFRMKGGPLSNRSSHGQFVRGFIEIVWMYALSFLKRGERLFQKIPLKELRITRASPEELEKLILWKMTSQLTTLDVSGRNLGERGIGLLADVSHLASIRNLRLQRCGIEDQGATELAKCWFDWPLVELDVTGNPISVIGLQRLRERFGSAVQFR